MNFIYIYLIVMNIITFVYMGVDKKNAVHHHFRIPERVLLVLSFLGGSFGTLLGMIFFHHKTQKMKFLIGIPLFLLSNVLFILYFFYQKSRFLYLICFLFSIALISVNSSA